jgi:ArsR family transcriptional regulator
VRIIILVEVSHLRGGGVTGGRGQSGVDLAKVFRALSDPTRLAIYQAIRSGGGGVYSPEQLENSISGIAARFAVSLSTVSHHIKELRNAGLVRCEKRGQTVYCSPNLEILEVVARFVGGGKE